MRGIDILCEYMERIIIAYDFQDMSVIYNMFSMCMKKRLDAQP